MMESTPASQNLMKYNKSIVWALIITAFIQLLYVGIIYLLGSAAQIIRTDLLYWPPIGIFTLEKMAFWHNFAIILGGFCMIQLIVGILYRIFKKSSVLQIIISIIAFLQLIFIPIGTIGGITALKALHDMNKSDLESISNQNAIKSINQEIGGIIVWVGFYHEGFLALLYLLTIYLSTMMLDLTYPMITMRILLQLRTWLFIIGGILGGQIIVGVLYTKYHHSISIRILTWFYAIIELLLIPVGTYAGILLLKELKSNV